MVADFAKIRRIETKLTGSSFCGRFVGLDYNVYKLMLGVVRSGLKFKICRLLIVI